VSAGTWTASVTVVDKLGNRSLPTTASFTSEPCGINPVLASVAAPTRPSGSLAFDPYTFTASAHSDDDDSTKCPARFAQTYAFVWSLASQPAGTVVGADYLFTSSAGTAQFASGTNGSYDVQVVATGSRQGSSTAHDVISVNCATPAPAVSMPGSVTLSDPDNYLMDGHIFSGDTVTVTGSATHACFTGANFVPSYNWALVSNDSNPQLVNVGATATFHSTIPNGSYALTFRVRDQWNHLGTRSHDFASDACGASPITATAAAMQGSSALPMDPWTLTASPATGTHFSDDSDSSRCPGRFTPTYTFAWSSVDAAVTAFSTATSNPSTFTPTQSKSYAITVVVSGNGQSRSANTTVNATCAAPSVNAPTVAQVNGTTPGTTIYVGDSVRVGTPSTSACFANPTLSYLYTLQRDGVPAPESFTPGANVAQPSFVPQAYGATYAVAVNVSDGSGQSTTSSTLNINVSQCGAAAPVVSLVRASQHFDSIHRATGTPPFPALDPTLTPPATEPTVTEGTDEFPVPFYLATPISVRVQVNSAVSASCVSFGFVGASLLDPDGAPVATADFTSLSPRSVTDHGNLDFTFTPRIGDRNFGTPVQLIPGNYQLKVTLTYGRPQTPSQNELAAPTVHVGGRCGLNAPFPDVTFNPLPPTVVGTTVTTDASPTSDADNVRLLFGSGPPSFSAGCGLDQSLTYAWALLSPTGSSAALSTAAGIVTSFRPDFVGNYDVQLTVADGTTSGANGDGTATTTFPYEAQPALAFASQPNTGSAGVTLGNFVVEFHNSDGSMCSSCSGRIDVAIQSGPSGGLLGGTTTLTGTGSVTFSDLNLSPADTYVLTATSATAGAATSTAIVISP